MGVVLHRLPDAEIEIQLQPGRCVIGRERVPKARLQSPLAWALDVEAKAAQEFSQVLSRRRVADLDFDAAMVPLKLPQVGHLPPIKF
jgi:hypothetical protein